MPLFRAALVAFFVIFFLCESGCNPSPVGSLPIVSCSKNEDCAQTEECLQSICIERGTTIKREVPVTKTEINTTERNTELVTSEISDEDGGAEPIRSKESEPIMERTEPELPPKTELPPTACIDGDKRSCFSFGDEKRSIGLCKDGKQVCISGTWGTCKGEVGPSKESCDGKDNDCNGQIDEPFLKKIGQPCSIGQGECSVVGVFACAKDGTKTICQAKGKSPSKEVCDGKDNDCDGQIDDLPQGKACDVKGLSGLCSKSFEMCVNGQLVCPQKVKPKSELCDGKDNDCDGQIDESFPSKGTSCRVGKGSCQNTGIWVCQKGGIGVKCNAVPKPPTKEVCDGKDNDCNGKTDEGCNCQNGHKQACYNASQGCHKLLPNGSTFSCVGTCQVGTQTCKQGQWGTCTGAILPTSELCDGKDNDCDGKIDNGNLGSGKTCTVPSFKGECAVGSFHCVNGQNECVATKKPQIEVCDGKDNDCDGVIDDNVSFVSPSCVVTGQKGECSKGEYSCEKGKILCKQVVKPSTELCDGKDNNCDGKIDNGNPESGGFCAISGQKGICAEGQKSCYQGKLICLQKNKPSSETCDGKDNDCNGKTDDGLPCQKGETRCGGLTKQSIFSCRSDCSGFSYKYTCNVINKEFCNDGQCKKCPCILNAKKCSGKTIMVCTFQKGVCGWYKQKKCKKRCISGIFGTKCR